MASFAQKLTVLFGSLQRLQAQAPLLQRVPAARMSIFSMTRPTGMNLPQQQLIVFNSTASGEHTCVLE